MAEALSKRLGRPEGVFYPHDNVNTDSGRIWLKEPGESHFSTDQCFGRK